MRFLHLLKYLNLRSSRKKDITKTQRPKKDRDIEKSYNLKQFVEKLRRVADCLENGERFDIQIDGERIYVPKEALFNIEHERGDGEYEIEFQIKWKINN